MRRVVLEFSDEVPEKNLQDEEILKKAKQGAVMELLRKGKISQGRAADLLNVSRHDLFDLIAKYDVPMANFHPEELERQRRDVAYIPGT